ncbi:MAG: DNA gyrase subunit A [Oscillospiraceae bacterium]|nr:MAG: DNA gyrase subunit A [Oscillospiraceae bacterium]
MEENLDLEFKNQKILDVHMEKEVKTSFIQYAMSVIVSRALPDVRDGLKPVHRRIIYAMYEDKITHDKAFYKSATTVGNVLGRYHPHGDSAVYESMVRLAQPFSLRYPLIEGHGNFGNIDGDKAAAYRYTEARLARLADEMTRDIEKDVVDFCNNFDNKRKEPTVLPSRIPNLLVNGSMGIAVGMATNIPPHNLCEVIDGTIFLMENPNATVSDLMNYIKGPDFPTGAIICGTAGIYEAYQTGRGKVTVRARVEVDDEKRRIIVTEIPYGVNKSNLVESIADCVKDKKIEGITAIRDESGRAGLRIVIEFKRDANGQVILNKLYKYTQLQDTCAINMLAIADNVPKLLGLKEILNYYIAHQENVITRRFNFELDKALKELHLNEGYKIAADNIDEVIKIIRGSESIQNSKENLIERFGLSDAQAQAIVEMTLGRLSGLERQKVLDKIAKLSEQVAEIRGILSSENGIKNVIKEELLQIKQKFGDARKTELAPVENEIIMEDLIERHTCIITMTNSGYIKRQPSDVYSAQHRGGKGIIGMTAKEEDFVEQVSAVNSHSYLLMFTNRGRVNVRKAYTIPESGRTTKGTNIVNIIELEENEKVTALVSSEDFSDKKYLTMVTKRGVIKRTRLSEFEMRRKGGKIAISLDDNDDLIYVGLTDEESRIVLATKNGFAVKFRLGDIRELGRTARGVRAIKLSDDDEVAGAAVEEDDKYLLTITENGYGKRTEFGEYNLHNRGGKGVHCHNTVRTGKIAGIAAVTADEDVMIITNVGTIIRVPVTDIPVYGRAAGGVIIMRQTGESKIVNFTCIAENKEKENTDDNEIENKKSDSDYKDEFSDDDTDDGKNFPDMEDGEI